VTEVLEALYHWSPVERRKEIRKHGLVPFSRPVTHSSDDLCFPYVSLSPTPSAAWSLSAAIVEEIDDWDLWMVRLRSTDEVHIRPLFGTIIEEVKVHNTISSERIWWAGTRSRPAAEDRDLDRAI
jgi:hypothetical protein